MFTQINNLTKTEAKIQRQEPVMQPDAKQDAFIWETEVLRFTAFPVPSAANIQSSWWSDLTGQQPETELNQAKLGTKHIEGVYGNGNFILELSPSRIDWLLAANIPDRPVIGSISIGEFTTTSNLFSGLMINWLHLNTIPKFRRLAFGGVVYAPVKNRIEGYPTISTIFAECQN